MTQRRINPFRLLRRFARGTKAVAAVEFALVAPLMLTLYLGSVDLSQGITADRKLASVAGTLGDLLAQANGTLQLNTLNDYFTASQAIMTPFDGNQTPLRMAIVSVPAIGPNSIVEHCVHNGAEHLVNNSPYPLPNEIRDIAVGGAVIVAEAWYTYEPVVGYVLPWEIELHKQFFYVPRFGNLIDIQPDC